MKEVRELRNSTSDTEDELTKLRHRLKVKEEENTNFSTSLHQLNFEKQDLSNKVNLLTRENENMMKIIEENED